jgi:hypothetical protein
MSLTLVKEDFVPEPRGSDEDVARLERANAIQAQTEILWGGPRGDGLVHTVTRLSQSVETLSQTVTILAQRVQGEDGIGAQLTMLKSEVAKAAAERALSDTRRDMWITGIGIGTVLELLRLLYNLTAGSHVGGH